jgi:hypothetical protein
MRGGNLRAHSNAISPTAFRARKERFAADAEKGAFLAEPENRGQPPANPLTDPAMMEGMMGMMKGNVAMMVSQTLIMGWINAFFSGFVISTDSCSNFPRSFRWWPRVAETLQPQGIRRPLYAALCRSMPLEHVLITANTSM